MANNVDQYVTPVEHAAIDHTGIPGVGGGGGGGDSFPIGAIVPFGGTVAAIAAGWLPCDGLEYDQLVEPSLFAVIGTTWDTGGETPGFFRVPDLRGKSALGLNDGTLPAGVDGGLTTRNLADTGGAETASHSHGVGSYTAASAGAHQHLTQATSTEILGPNVANGVDLAFGNDNSHHHTFLTLSAGAHGHSLSGTGAVSAPGTMQPFAVCPYIIKAQQVGGSTGITAQNNGGALQGPRPTLNLIPAGGTSLLVADNPGQSRVDVTITSPVAATPALTLIEKKEILAAVTDVTFAGLDGDTDGVYMLVSKIVPNTAINNFFSFRPNGSAASQSGSSVSLAAAYSHSALGFLRLMTTFGTNQGFGTAYFWARKAGPGATPLSRNYIAQSNAGQNGSKHHGVWGDTSTNVTSIVINSQNASEIGVGSTFALYKLLI